ncbi:mediator of RNA polymerase II transcription subunit 4 isoform X3 [Choloepus didactylus]|uniref:mediator of RNA polymerase II transcription subunit 4 isoform X3 n=1 Tax=Choloepus didactylus TaxID=27675 RepID=UPI0018A0E298|nr:mediator of RNA polymerase II transcription subunit 4 isoform X3 [Choloepus didactylus]
MMEERVQRPGNVGTQDLVVELQVVWNGCPAVCGLKFKNCAAESNDSWLWSWRISSDIGQLSNQSCDPASGLFACWAVYLRELIEMLAISRNQKMLHQPGEENQILELLIHRDGEFQELMKLALNQGKIHHEMQVLEKEVEKRDSDIQQLQKQLKEAEQILATAVYQAKEKLKSIEKARKGAISSEEIIKYAHRISASNAVCAPLTWVPGDPRRPYPTDLEMRSGLLGQMNNPSTNGVNGHLPGDALAAGRLPVSVAIK